MHPSLKWSSWESLMGLYYLGHGKDFKPLLLIVCGTGLLSCLSSPGPFCPMCMTCNLQRRSPIFFNSFVYYSYFLMVSFLCHRVIIISGANVACRCWADGTRFGFCSQGVSWSILIRLFIWTTYVWTVFASDELVLWRLILWDLKFW